MTGPPGELLVVAEAMAGAEIGITIGDASRPGFPLVYVNPAFERMTGYEASEILGRSCAFLQDAETEREPVEELRRALREGRSARVTLRNVRKDGRPFWNELRLAPHRTDGEPGYVLGFQLDVTHTVQTLDELRAARAHAENQLREADELIATQQIELDELRSLQAALTPPPGLAVRHLDVATAFEPAEAGVAGDFFLVAAGPEDSVTIAVGDVVGHGLRAARRASFVRASLATFAAFTDDPGRLLELANNSLLERAGTSERFVTAVCASFRPGRDEVALALAGHPPPHWLDRGSPVADVSGGLPLGLGLELGVRSTTLELTRGDGLLFFTDGLPEARSAERRAGPGERLYGEPRVEALLQELDGASAHETVAVLTDAVRSFARGPLADDLCVVAARRMT